MIVSVKEVVIDVDPVNDPWIDKLYVPVVAIRDQSKLRVAESKITPLIGAASV